jgi:SWI/SNF-related matrix-associated actin-dependent regulator of chromatin subfamily A-like protein 1
LAKVPYVIEHVTKLLEQDGIRKVVVFAHHRDVITALMEAFAGPYQAVCYKGEMTEAMKHRSVDLFQTWADCRVFIGSITAAGVGLTLTAASHMVFAEIDWKDMRQAEDRIHRIGQTETCIYQTLVFDWSVDANMMRKILEKMRIAEVAIDGKGVVEEKVKDEIPDAEYEDL